MDAHRNYLAPLLPPDGTGLDLAGGAGHHALWLAKQGWRMTLSDWSEVALEMAAAKAKDLAAAEKIEIVPDAARGALELFRSQNRKFNFVLVSFFLDRAILPLLPEILEPNGLLLYRTYTIDNKRLGNPRGPRNPDYLLRPQELLEIYRDMTILHYNETVFAKSVAELIAQNSSIHKGLA